MILTVLPFKSFTRQCKYTLFPKCVVTLTLPLGSSKYGNGSCVVVSSPSSISFSSGVSVNGDENSCQKFFGNESNGSPSRGFTTATRTKWMRWTTERKMIIEKKTVSTWNIKNRQRNGKKRESERGKKALKHKIKQIKCELCENKIVSKYENWYFLSRSLWSKILFSTTQQ